MLRPRSVSPIASGGGVRSGSPLSSVVPHEVAVKESEVCRLKEQLSIRDQQLVDKDREIETLRDGDKRELEAMRSIVGEKVHGKVQQALQWNEATVKLNEKLAEKDDAITSLVDQLSTSETKHDSTKLQLADIVAKSKCKDRAAVQSAEEIELIKKQNESLTAKVNSLLEISKPSNEHIARRDDVEGSQYEHELQVKQIIDMVLSLEHFISNFNGDLTTPTRSDEEWNWDTSMSTFVTIGTPGDKSEIHQTGTDLLVTIHGTAIPRNVRIVPKGQQNTNTGFDLIVVGFGGLMFPPTAAQRISNSNTFLLKPYTNTNKSGSAERVGIRLVSASSGSLQVARTFLTNNSPKTPDTSSGVSLEVFSSPDPVHPGGDVKNFIAVRIEHELLSPEKLSNFVKFDSVRMTSANGIISSSVTRMSVREGGYLFSFTTSPNCGNSIEFKVTLELQSGEVKDHWASVAVRRQSGSSLQQQIPIHMRSLRCSVIEKLSSLYIAVSDTTSRMIQLTENSQKKDETTTAVVDRLEKNELSLVAQLNAYQSELSDVSATVDQYNREACIREDKFILMERQLQKLTADLASAEIALSESKHQIVTSLNEKSLLENEVSNLMKNNSQLSSHISDLQITLKENNLKNDNKNNNTVELLKQQLADLDKQSKDSEKQSKELREESSSLRQELHRLRIVESELTSSQSQLMLTRTTSEQQIKLQNDKITILEKEVSSLRGTTDEVEAGELSQKVLQLQSKLENFQNIQTNPHIIHLTTTNSELQRELQSLRESEARLIQTQQKNSLDMRTNLEHIIQKEQDKNLTLQQQINDLQTQLKYLKSSEEKTPTTEDHFAKLQEQGNVITEDRVTQLQQQLQVSEMEVSSLRSQVTVLHDTQHHLDLSDSVLSQEELDEDRQREAAFLRSAADQAVLTEKGKTHLIEKQLRGVQEENDLLIQKLNEKESTQVSDDVLQETINTLQNDKQQLQEQLTSLQTELVGLKTSQITQPTSTVNESIQGINTTKQSEDVPSTTSNELISINSELQIDKEKLTTEIEELRNSTELTVLAEQEKGRRSEKEIIQLGSKILSLERSLEDLNEEKVSSESRRKTLQQSNADLQVKFTSLEEANNKSESNLLSSKEQVVCLTQELDNEKQSVVVLKGKLSSLEEANNTSEGNLLSAQEELSMINKSLDVEKQSVVVLKGKLSSLEEANNTAEGNLLSAQEELSMINKSLDVEKQSVVVLKGKLSSLEEANNTSEGNLLSAQEELSMINKSLDVEKQQVSDLRKQLTSVEEIISNLKNSEKESTGNMKRELQEAEEVISNLRQTNNDMSDKYLSVDKLKSTIESDLISVKEQFTSIKDSLDDSHQKYKNTEKNLIATKRKLALSEQAELNLLTKQQQIETEFQSMRKQLTSLVADKDDLSQNQHRLKSLQTKLEKTENQLSISSETISALQQTEIQLKKQLSESSGQASEEKEIELLEIWEKLTTANTTTSHLKDQLEKAEAVISALQRESNQLKSHLSDVEQIDKDKDAELQTIKEQLTQTMSDTDSSHLKEQLVKAEAAISALQSVEVQLKKQLSEVEQASQEKENELLNIGEKLTATNTTTSHLQEQLVKAEATISDLQRESNQLKNHLSDVEQIDKDKDAELQTIKEQLTQTMSDTDSSHLKKQLLESEAAISDLQSVEVQLKKQLSEVEQASQEKENELLNIGEKLTATNTTTSHLQEQLVKAEATISALQSEQASREKEIELLKTGEKLPTMSLQEQLVKAEANYSALQHQLSEAEKVAQQEADNTLKGNPEIELRNNQVAKLETQLAASKQQILRHEEAESHLLSENDVLENDIKTLKSDNVTSQSEIKALEKRLHDSEEQSLHVSAELSHLRQEVRSKVPTDECDNTEQLTTSLSKVKEELELSKANQLELFQSKEKLLSMNSELSKQLRAVEDIDRQLANEKNATQMLSQKLLSSQQEVVRLQGGSSAALADRVIEDKQLTQQKQLNDSLTNELSSLRDEVAEFQRLKSLKGDGSEAISQQQLQLELENSKSALLQEKDLTHKLSQKLLQSQEQQLQLAQNAGDYNDIERELRQQLKSVTAEVALAKQQQEKTESDPLVVKDRILNSQSDLKEALSELHAARKDVQTLRETLEIEVRAQSPLNDNDSSSTALRKRLLTTQADLQRALQEISIYKSTEDVSNVISLPNNDEINNLKGRLQSTQSDLKNALRDLQDAHEELNILKVTIPISSNEDIQEELASARQELFNLNNKYNKITSEYGQLERQLKMAEKELIDALDSNSQQDNSSFENEGLKKRVLELASELLSITSEKDEFAEKITSLETELRAAVEGADQVVEDWTVFEGNHYKLAEEHAATKAQNNFIANQQIELSMMVEELENQLSTKTDELNLHKRQLISESDRVSDLESVILNLQQEAESLRDLKAMSEQQEMRRQSLDNQRNNFEKEVTELTNDNTTLTATIESLEYDSCVQTAHIENLQTQLRKLTQENESKHLREKNLLRAAEGSNHTLDSMEVENQSLRQKISQLENMIHNLRSCASSVVCTLQPSQVVDSDVSGFVFPGVEDDSIAAIFLSIQKDFQTKSHIMSLEENCERECLRTALLAGGRKLEEITWEAKNNTLSHTLESLSNEIVLEKESHKSTMNQLVAAEEALGNTETQRNKIEFEKAHIEGILAASKTQKACRTAEAESRAEITNLEFIKMEGRYLSEEAKNAELRATMSDQQEDINALRKELAGEKSVRQSAESKMSRQSTFLAIREVEITDDTQVLLDAEQELVNLKSVLGALQNERRLDQLQQERLETQISEEKSLRCQAEQKMKHAKQMVKDFEVNLTSRHENSISDLREEVLHISSLKAEREQQVAELFRRIESTSLELNIQKHRAATSELALKEANKEILSLRPHLPRYQQHTRRSKSVRSTQSSPSVQRGPAVSPIKTSTVILER